MFTFDEKKYEVLAHEKIRDQMAFLGYESHNSMRILGTISVFLVWWIIKLLLLPIFYIISARSIRVTKWYKEFKRAMIWGALFITILEAYIELLIASNLNLEFPIFTYSGDMASYIFAMFCSSACSLVILSFFYLSCLTLEKL